MNPPSGPNCWRCQFFAVSHHPRHPYACRLYGFEAKVLPCIEVLRIDGQLCAGFEAKPTRVSAAASTPPAPSRVTPAASAATLNSSLNRQRPSSGSALETWV